MYEHLCEVFGVNNRGWDDIHLYFSPSMFCAENRISLVGEYLVWINFVRQAKRFDVPYYWGIDAFLREYKKAVESCLNANRIEI